jgi:hypothetical protein
MSSLSAIKSAIASNFQGRARAPGWTANVKNISRLWYRQRVAAGFSGDILLNRYF